MANLFSFVPVPAVVLLLLLVVITGAAVFVKRQFASKKSRHSAPAAGKLTQEETVNPTKITEEKPKKRAAPKKTEKLFYVLGILSWIVLLWPIIIYLQSESQTSRHVLLPEEEVVSSPQTQPKTRCDRITFFDAKGRKIAADEISNRFVPGDTLLIAVGSREGETAEKARVRINSTVWTDKNEIHEKSINDSFVLECPVDALSNGRPTICGIPIGERGKFAVEAEIFDLNDGVWK